MSPPDTLHQLSITAQLATPVCHALPLHMFCYFLPWASDVTTPMALHMLVPQLHHFLPFYPYTTFVRHLLRSFLHSFTIGAVVLASPPHPRPLQLGA